MASALLDIIKNVTTPILNLIVPSGNSSQSQRRQQNQSSGNKNGQQGNQNYTRAKKSKAARYDWYSQITSML